MENEAVEITIKRGDNFWNLARTYNMTVADLEILNPDVDPHRIYPGDKLVISPFNPVLDVLIELENTVVETDPLRHPVPKEQQHVHPRKADHQTGG